MFQSRTHTCGELRLSDAGKTVTISGWLENVREVGANFAFLVLRDFYGTTQVVVENEQMMQIIKGIHKESTISVTGTVRERERARTPSRLPVRSRSFLPILRSWASASTTAFPLRSISPGMQTRTCVLSTAILTCAILLSSRISFCAVR